MLSLSNRKINSTARRIRIRNILSRGGLCVVVVAGFLCLQMTDANMTHAQTRGYWATDGCYYQHNGYQWQRVECRYYDRNARTWVARNGRGTFYLYNGRWHDEQGYLAALVQEMVRPRPNPHITVIPGNDCPPGTFGCRYPQAWP